MKRERKRKGGKDMVKEGLCERDRDKKRDRDRERERKNGRDIDKEGLCERGWRKRVRDRQRDRDREKRWERHG